jgi:hypothetical protein
MSNQSINPQISELCKRVPIVGYLEKRGIQVHHYGKTRKCCCPLLSHKGGQESTPSFYIYDASDGAEIFKCFGCGESGNIISLMARLEDKKNGEIVKRLSSETGVELGEYDPSMRVEPTPDEIMASFCAEDDTSLIVSMLLRNFIQTHKGSEDAINKACRIYQMMDDFRDYGEGVHTSQKYSHLGVEDLYGVETYAIKFVNSYRDKEE